MQNFQPADCWITLGISLPEPLCVYLFCLTADQRFWNGIWRFGWLSSGRSFYVAIVCRRDIHDVHNDNFFPLIYLLEITLNWNDFNPKYPKNPQNLGEKIRKARMDKGLLIRKLASQLGVTEETVINWEVRGVKPTEKSIEKIRDFLEFDAGSGKIQLNPQETSMVRINRIKL